MKKSGTLFVIGYSVMGLLSFVSEAAGSSAENRPKTSQALKDTGPERCTGPIPEGVLRCADGAFEEPFWVDRDGECKLIAACFAHGEPLQFGGHRVVGTGEECNGSLPPDYATLCDDNLTCVLDNARLGSSGTCMTIGHLGDRCDSTAYEIRWVQCEEGLQCKALSTPISIGIVPVMACQQ